MSLEYGSVVLNELTLPYSAPAPAPSPSKSGGTGGEVNHALDRPRTLMRASSTTSAVRAGQCQPPVSDVEKTNQKRCWKKQPRNPFFCLSETKSPWMGWTTLKLHDVGGKMLKNPTKKPCLSVRSKQNRQEWAQQHKNFMLQVENILKRPTKKTFFLIDQNKIVKNGLNSIKMVGVFTGFIFWRWRHVLSVLWWA